MTDDKKDQPKAAQQDAPEQEQAEVPNSTDTNAGPDAKQGTVADMPDNPPEAGSE